MSAFGAATTTTPLVVVTARVDKACRRSRSRSVVRAEMGEHGIGGEEGGRSFNNDAYGMIAKNGNYSLFASAISKVRPPPTVADESVTVASTGSEGMCCFEHRRRPPCVLRARRMIFSHHFFSATRSRVWQKKRFFSFFCPPRWCLSPPQSSPAARSRVRRAIVQEGTAGVMTTEDASQLPVLFPPTSLSLSLSRAPGDAERSRGPLRHSLLPRDFFFLLFGFLVVVVCMSDLFVHC